MTPILRVVAGEARGEVRGVLDEIVAEGAPRMLAAALEAELDTYLARLARSRTSAGIRLMVLRGHAEPPTITTGAGGIEVRASWVHDRRTEPQAGQQVRFRGAILHHHNQLQDQTVPEVHAMRWCPYCASTAMSPPTSPEVALDVVEFD